MPVMWDLCQDTVVLKLIRQHTLTESREALLKAVQDARFTLGVTEIQVTSSSSTTCTSLAARLSRRAPVLFAHWQMVNGGSVVGAV
jgi:hypothetical protein